MGAARSQRLANKGMQRCLPKMGTVGGHSSKTSSTPVPLAGVLNLQFLEIQRFVRILDEAGDMGTMSGMLRPTDRMFVGC